MSSSNARVFFAIHDSSKHYLCVRNNLTILKEMQRNLITHRQHYSNKKSPEQRSWKKARLYHAVLCN